VSPRWVSIVALDEKEIIGGISGEPVLTLVGVTARCASDFLGEHGEAVRQGLREPASPSGTGDGR
jgi:hypothetical protein